MGEAENLVEGKAVTVEKRYDIPGLPGGWVRLRRWNHGESNRRTDSSMTLSVSAEGERPEVIISTTKSRRFDFQCCIVDHNVSFAGKKADFRIGKQVDGLDFDLGEAIATLISDHNEPVEPDDIPKSG